MPRVQDLIHYLMEFAPLDLAEDWDNVGLLLGDAAGQADRVMTCLTLTPDVAAEAIRDRVDVIVAHHPILFRAVKRVNTGTIEGRMLLDLIRANISVYSPHTAFDSALGGINAQLADRLGLRDVRPLRPIVGDVPSPQSTGSGRYGELSEPVDFHAFLQTVLRPMRLTGCEAVATDRRIGRVAIACGSAAEFLPDAGTAGCDVLITGEARFHAALEARARGIGLILLGHYASERFALETLATTLADEFPDATVWASRDERDPLKYIVKH